MLTMQNDSLNTERLELEAEARAWFDPLDDETLAELERLDRVLASSSMLDLARPDGLNLALVRSLARLAPAEWDDAHVFAGIALAALHVAAGDVDDEAYSLRYLAAGRDALRLADLADAPNVPKRELAAAHEARAFERTLAVADAFRELHALPWKEKVPAIAERLGLSESTVERHRSEAARLGIPLEPLT
jgi:hypothetical protein